MPEDIDLLAGWRRELAHLRSWSLSRQLGIPLPAEMSYSLPRMLRNAAAIDIAAREIPQMLGADAEDLLGQFWEAAGFTTDDQQQFQIASLSAAIAYELAGYQANAVAALRSSRIVPDKAMEAVRLFLKRQLVLLRRNIETVLSAERDLVSADTAIILLALDDLTTYLFTGHLDILQKAQRRLNIALGQLTAEGDYLQANFLTALLILSHRLPERTMWSLLSEWLEGDNIRRRYVFLAARGSSSDILAGHSAVELWPPQIKAIQNGLVDDVTLSLTLHLPTSSGKTKITELAIVSTLSKNLRAIYIAPYRSLGSELTSNFKRLFSDLGFSVTNALGAFELDPLQEEMVSAGDLIVMTPERLDQVLRSSPDSLSDVGLVICDEIHLIEEPRRGLKLDFMMTRIRQELPNAKFLSVSAMLSDNFAAELATWLASSKEGHKYNTVGGSWRPSRQTFAVLNWLGEDAFLEYRKAPISASLQEPDSTELFHRRTVEYIKESTQRRNRRVLPKDKADMAALAALRFSALGPVLIYTSQPDWTHSIARAILDIIQVDPSLAPAWWTTDTRMRRAAQIANEWLSEDSLRETYSHGVAIHHGQLPEALREAVERDARDNLYNIIICTSTLAQGVNLPVRTVIMHSAVRFENERSVPMPARDYWNIAGRAGRAGQESEGLIIHICAKQEDIDSADHFYRSWQTNPDGVSPLYRAAAQTISERINLDEFGELLDAELITLALEESEADALEFAWRTTTKTLGYSQAMKRRVSIEPLRTLINKSMHSIFSLAPSLLEREAFSATGLPPKVCSEILRRLRSLDDLAALLQESSLHIWMNVVGLVLADVGEFADIGVSLETWQAAAISWMAGAAPHELVKEMQRTAETTAPQARKIVDHHLVYLLPWYTSAMLSLASYETGVSLQEASEFVQMLPLMLKYGVASPSACKALAIGITSRSLAQRLADAHLEGPQSTSFRNWLQELSIDELMQQFNVEGVMLRDLSNDLRALATDKELVERIRNDEVFPYRFTVVTQRGQGSAIARTLTPGLLCRLKRDYETLVDRNAVMLIFDGIELGQLSRRASTIISPAMDFGIQFAATIERLENLGQSGFYAITASAEAAT